MRAVFAPLAGAPAPAIALGLAGLVPFVGLASLAVLQRETWYAYWLVALSHYGATIVAFVGAIHWGVALVSAAQGPRAWLRYGWSVVPDQHPPHIAVQREDAERWGTLMPQRDGTASI